MKRKHIGMLPVFLALLVLFTACAGRKSSGTDRGEGSDEMSENEQPIVVTGDSYPLAVRDFVGDVTVLEKKPERVAVLSGTVLNVWYDVGGTAVCTVTISSTLKVVKEYEDEIRALPSVGKQHLLSLEPIVAYEPDLIIAQENAQRESIVRLREMGYKVIVTCLRDLDDALATYRAFGKIVGNEERGIEKADALKARYDAIRVKAPEHGKKVVILYLTSKKLQVKLDGSIAGSIAKDLGLNNIASGLSPVSGSAENAALDIEYLIEHQPDVILVTSMISNGESAAGVMKEYLESPAWQGVTAVQKGNIVYLPQEYFLYHAGPYFDESLRYMASSVYPEIYGETGEWYGK